MSILHTKEYEKQKDDLDVEDMRATWAVMGQLTKEGEEVMAIYNCGAEAGASQGHKHLQIFPRPTSQEFELYPRRVRLEEGKAAICEGVPYKHSIMPIPSDATAEDVYAIYEQLLDGIRPILREHGTEDYNLVLVKEWMLVIPRRRHGRGGGRSECGGDDGLAVVERQGGERGMGEVRLHGAPEVVGRSSLRGESEDTTSRGLEPVSSNQTCNSSSREKLVKP